MYIVQNVYGTDARYIDLSDPDFFHYSLQIAKNKFNEDKQNDVVYTSNDIEEIKKNQTPVFFASNLSKRTDKEIFVKRKGLKDRLRRKYLIIDADFSRDEKEESEILFNKVIDLANRYQTPLVIYPTASYPEKPRFRVVFFVKRMLNETSYEKAMRWLYNELDTVANDNDDYRITGNNNAPIFFNDAQLDKIVDTTQDEDLQLLDNKLWKDIKVKKKKNRVANNSFNKYDRFTIKDEEFIEMLQIVKIDTYDEFWKFVYSLIRAEKAGQITEDQSKAAMGIITHRAPNEETALQWEGDNLNFYRNSKSRVDSGLVDVTRAMPITSMSEYAEAIQNV